MTTYHYVEVRFQDDNWTLEWAPRGDPGFRYQILGIIEKPLTGSRPHDEEFDRWAQILWWES